MVLTMDEEGGRARYQMQTGSILVRVWVIWIGLLDLPFHA